jgi:peptidoglycan/xylan/chitin deacetylase (PgdA/CDA1 family)
VRAAAKEVLGCVVRFSGLPRLVRATVARRRAAILVYHDPTPERLRAHLEYLAPRFDFLSLPELVDALRSRQWGALPSRPLVLTLDDGHAGNAALEPVLREFAVRPMIYVCSQIVATNRHFWFRDVGSHFPRLLNVSDEERRQFLSRRLDFVESAEHAERHALSRDELVDLRDVAHFGSHTQWHPVLPACSDAVARAEIYTSKADLEELLDQPCLHFSFPNGDYSDRDVELVREAGYLSARTTDFGWVGPGADPFRLPILALPDDASVNVLAAYFSGILALKRAVKPRRRVAPALPGRPRAAARRCARARTGRRAA